MYQLYFYVPESHLEIVKRAVFQANAGAIGNYDQCCWQTAGQGQFRANQDAHPHLGTPGDIELVSEYKVEVICCAEDIDAVKEALLQSHPYETPAFGIIKLAQ